jgi:hypothetical protein
MDMMRVTVRAGQKPTNEQVLEIRAAAKRPITYTEDCPESTPAALAEFAAKARELRRSRNRTGPIVTLRLSSVASLSLTPPPAPRTPAGW